ncbi:hypothetical protein ACFPRL_14400 [Pseudoclavibacter helvolus]
MTFVTTAGFAATQPPARPPASGSASSQPEQPTPGRRPFSRVGAALNPRRRARRPG